MLTLEIKLNGKLIGGATIQNVSRLADVSDYKVMACESASDVSGLGDFRQEFDLKNFRRLQTVWAIVAEVAAKARRLNSVESAS